MAIEVIKNYPFTDINYRVLKRRKYNASINETQLFNFDIYLDFGSLIFVRIKNGLRFLLFRFQEM